MYSEDASVAEAVAAELGVRHSPDGIVAAGMPVGDEDFVASHMEAKADHSTDGRATNLGWKSTRVGRAGLEGRVMGSE